MLKMKSKSVSPQIYVKKQNKNRAGLRSVPSLTLVITDINITNTFKFKLHKNV